MPRSPASIIALLVSVLSIEVDAANYGSSGPAINGAPTSNSGHTKASSRVQITRRARSTATTTTVVSNRGGVCSDAHRVVLKPINRWVQGSRCSSGRGKPSPAGGVDEVEDILTGVREAVAVLRGGSTGGAKQARGGREQEPGQFSRGARSMRVQVSTTKMSSYIDARGEVTAQSDWTVGRLKEEVEKKFPGKIPASLQRLFKGTQLLPSSVTLEELSEGGEGPLVLLLDNAPPIDSSRFDPDTAVPSRRDGQVEAFSACLAAQATLEQSLLGTMRGASDGADSELTRSLRMKADFENTKALLQRTLEERPDTSVGQQPPQQAFGVLHEALRPLAHSLDVNWLQSAQYAIFVYICAQFGAHGAVRRALTLMLIPLIFLAQTRPARVGLKLARNLAGEIPVLTQLVLGLLQAPGQVILSLDADAYTRNLYGPEGPTFDEAFLDSRGGDDGIEDVETSEDCGGEFDDDID